MLLNRQPTLHRPSIMAHKVLYEQFTYLFILYLFTFMFV